MLGVAPFIRIATAGDILRFADGTRVTTPAAYIAWHRAHMDDAGVLARDWRYGNAVAARVNHGRWIADCPNCAGGALTHPVWRLACCGACGCVMTKVTFPTDLAAIERALLRRPVRDAQNWSSDETAEDLERENVAHGVR